MYVNERWKEGRKKQARAYKQRKAKQHNTPKAVTKRKLPVFVSLSLCIFIQLIDVALMENVLAKGKLKVSSNDAMANRYSAIPLVIPSLKSQGFPVRS